MKILKLTKSPALVFSSVLKMFSLRIVSILTFWIAQKVFNFHPYFRPALPESCDLPGNF